MGKPRRAIKSRRLTMTPELCANIRRRYEHTSESVSAMAADLGCTGQTVDNIAKREGWVRYVPPPRDLSPAAKLLARAEALAAPPTPNPSPPFAARTGGGEENAAPPAQNDTAAVSAQPLQVADTAEHLHRELHELLAEVRAARVQMKREGAGKYALREISGTIASLSAVLRTLLPILRPVPASIQPESAYDDMPADLDEFRRELARRIRIFVEGRRARRDAGAASADDAAAAQS